jgi:ribonuclease HII
MSKIEWEPVAWRSFKPAPIIGVDEVGRGCLAGPVYAGAAVLQDWQDCKDSKQSKDLKKLEESLTDSKLLTPKKRDELAKQIRDVYQVSIAWASEAEIEELNIFQASLLAMKRAVEGLKVLGGHILVDGKFEIPNFPIFKQTALIKGDLRAAPISAAAICAKVARDQKMLELAEKYPNYGLEKHKGYATEIHRNAIKKWGPTPIHRRTFEGVREYLIQ